MNIYLLYVIAVYIDLSDYFTPFSDFRPPANQPNQPIFSSQSLKTAIHFYFNSLHHRPRNLNSKLNCGFSFFILFNQKKGEYNQIINCQLLLQFLRAEFITISYFALHFVSSSLRFYFSTNSYTVCRVGRQIDSESDSELQLFSRFLDKRDKRNGTKRATNSWKD